MSNPKIILLQNRKITVHLSCRSGSPYNRRSPMVLHRRHNPSPPTNPSKPKLDPATKMGYRRLPAMVDNSQGNPLLSHRSNPHNSWHNSLIVCNSVGDRATVVSLFPLHLPSFKTHKPKTIFLFFLVSIFFLSTA